jgi:Secretion system C-terminal sorting domain
MAQSAVHVCGTSEEDQEIFSARLKNNITTAQMQGASDRGVVKYVPIHFHRVADSDQVGRVRELRVLEQLCTLNEDYLSQNIQFYLSPHPIHGLMNSTINNDNVYNTQSNAWLMNSKKHTKALNVFVSKDAVSGNTPPDGGTTLAYYSPQQDWVVSRKDQINGNGNGTISHEIGHFFSLRHTFYGWESDPFDPTDAGWPIAPAISPGGSPTEKMDGSNCTTAADLICDTPPDYNFGYIQSGCGTYVGGAKDPMGVLVNPMENNFMSYFSGCDYEFTQGQADVIAVDLNTPERNYLDNSFVPAAETITVPTDLLVAPIGNDTTAFFNQVELSWNTVTGATYYLLEIDITSGYSTADYQAFILTENSKSLSNLKINKQYYWRVKPFNELYTCSPSKASSFRTSNLSTTGVSEIKNLNNWRIQPNPVQTINDAQIFVEAEKSFEANVLVTDATGKQIFSELARTFNTGNNTYNLGTSKLANGVYFVSLVSGDARMTQRLVVIE